MDGLFAFICLLVVLYLVVDVGAQRRVSYCQVVCSFISFVVLIHFEFQCSTFCILSGHTVVGCFYLLSIRIDCVLLLSRFGAAFEFRAS